MERPYKTWGFPVIPIVAIVAIIPAWLISLVLLKPPGIGVYLGWMVLGVLYYLIFRRNVSN